MNRPRVRRRLTLAFALAAAGLVLPGMARGGGQSTRITQQIPGPTQDATDLHVKVNVGAKGTITSASMPPFTSKNTKISGNEITGNLADVKAGQKVKLDIEVDGNDHASISEWSWSKPVEGIFETITADANLNFLSNPNGTVTAYADNLTGQPLTYANLELATGADGSFFNGDLAAGLATGKPVALDVPASGAFQPGVTDLATFTPVTTFDTYTGLVGQVGGLDFGRATLVTPEPGTLALLASAAPALYLLWRHRKRARRA